MIRQNAEREMQKASRELADWKAVAAICRKNIAKDAPWPGDKSVA
jgi:hypothetical protein